MVHSDWTVVGLLHKHSLIEIIGIYVL